MAGGVRRGGRADSGDVHAERAGVVGGAAAEGAEADEDDAVPGEDGAVRHLPNAVALVGEYIGHAVDEHEQRHEAVFAGLGGVGTAVVEQGDAVGKPVERRELIEAGGGYIDHLQLGRRRQAFGDSGGVGHEHLGVLHAGGKGFW